ncbi:hypothetical protein BGX27_004945 [Mortierella sp. AM989]|nr:hypothetical protein BGX27_004945 [Mortierella sp. AM989]
MKTSTIIFVITALVLTALVLVDAAAVKKNDKSKGKSKGNKGKKDQNTKKKVNPHALSAEEERFTTCGTTNDVFQIKTISSNQHLCSGCKACIDLDGVLTGTIDKGAKVRLEVSKYYISVFDQEFDLCQILEGVEEGPKCPIKPTDKGLRACLPLDTSLTTDVLAGIKVTGFTSTGKSLFCVEGSAMIESQCPKDVGPGSYACMH